MTPKEKANLLYNKMVVDFGIDHWQIKQCALVAVDEIMKAIGWNEMELGVDRDNYWEEVKQEIEKL
jgi:hypothetical protein